MPETAADPSAQAHPWTNLDPSWLADAPSAPGPEPLPQVWPEPGPGPAEAIDEDLAFDQGPADDAGSDRMAPELAQPDEPGEPAAPVAEPAAEESADAVVVLGREVTPEQESPASAQESPASEQELPVPGQAEAPVEPDAAEQGPAEELLAQEPAVQTTAVDDAAVQDPTVQVPAVQEPTIQIPAAQVPAAQLPATRVPAAGRADRPADAPAAESPLTAAPASGRSAAPSRPRPGPHPPRRPAKAHSPRRPAKARPHRRPVTAGITALAVVLIAGATVALVLSSRNSAVSSSDRGSANALVVERARIVDQVATWVAGQVSHHAVVSCEQAMCDALAQHGFPAGSLRTIARKATGLPKSEIVVATSLVEQQFGKKLDAKLAPVVLAGFGKAGLLTSVRAVAPHGASAYLTELRVDFKLRQTVGTGLITSRQITASTAARKMMESGEVDSRLLIVITALAAGHPIDILTFGAPSPGASPGVPLRVAELAETSAGVNLTESAYVQAMETLLKAQPARYRPDSIASVRTATGQKVLRIEFPAPSPLGLLNPTQ